MSVYRLFHRSSAVAVAAVLAASPQLSWSQEDSEDSFDVEEVVVTGSRIVRSGASAPTPPTSLGAEDVTLSGELSVSDIITDLPSANAAVGNSTSAFLITSPGVETANLRGLQLDRTLVLINGRRTVGFPIALTNQVAVDLSTIPTASIERVETVTGGSSAVYGTDAIAGVINIILKDDFEGFEIDVLGGITDEGDGESVRVSGIWGGRFADDRGKAVISFEYQSTDEVNLDDRFPENGNFGFPFGDTSQGFVEGADNSGALGIGGSVGLVGGGAADFAAALQQLGLPDAATGFNAFIPATGVIEDLFPPTNGFDARENTFAILPTERFLVSANAEFKINDYINSFFTGSFANTRASTQISPVFGVNGITPIAPTDPDTGLIPTSAHPNLPIALQNAIDAIAADPTVGGAFPDGVALPEFVTTVRNITELGQLTRPVDNFTTRLLGGFNGEIDFDRFGSWNWEVYGQYSRVVSDQPFFGNVDDLRSAVTLSQDACDSFNELVGLTNSGLAIANSTCPGVIDLFADGSTSVPVLGADGAILGFERVDAPGEIGTPFSDTISDEVLEFISFEEIRRITNRQILGGFAISGQPIDLPAGPLGVAFGYEYRDEDASDISSPTSQQGLAAAGGTNATSFASFESNEVYWEVDIPLLANIPFIEYLNVTGAARFSNFTQVEGSNFSWKIGANWTVNPDFRIRGTFDSAFRAPNVSEIATAAGTGFTGAVNPCELGSGADFEDPNLIANCASFGVVAGEATIQGQFPTQTAGNPDLSVETADTFSVGFVYTPRYVPGLSITVDYFDIEVDGTIADGPDPQSIANACFSSAGLSAPECDAVILSASTPGFIDLTLGGQVNEGTTETAGFDIEASYGFDIADLVGSHSDFGFMNLRFLATVLTQFEFADGAGQITDAIGAFAEFESGFVPSAFPRLRFNFRPTYNYGPLTVGWNLRFLGQLSSDPLIIPVDGEAFRPNEGEPGDEISPQLYSDLNFSYQVTEWMTLRGGINNIFDNPTPIITDEPTQGRSFASVTNRSVYDFRGRFFFGGVRFNF